MYAPKIPFSFNIYRYLYFDSLRFVYALVDYFLFRTKTFSSNKHTGCDVIMCSLNPSIIVSRSFYYSLYLISFNLSSLNYNWIALVKYLPTFKQLSTFSGYYDLWTDLANFFNQTSLIAETELSLILSFLSNFLFLDIIASKVICGSEYFLGTLPSNRR